MAYVPAQNTSVSGTVGASIIGNVPIKGLSSVGAAPAGFPVMIGAQDTSGNVTYLSTDPSGDLFVTQDSSIISLIDNAPNQLAIPVGKNDAAFMVNPTYGYMFDGATWDRIRGNSSDGLFVNVTGSVATTGGTSGNSSVQVVGAVPPHSVSGVGTFNVNPVGNGSVIATLTNSSVTALQGTNPWLTQIVSSVATRPTPASVQLLGGSNVIGSVTTLQGTNPWVTVGSVQGTMSVLGTVPVTQAGTWTTYQAAGSVMAVSTTVNTGNSSVQLVGGTAMIGSVTAYQGTTPWIVNITPSVIAYQLAGSIMATSATVNTGNSSVQLVGGTAMTGSVAAYQGATAPWRVELTSGSIATTAGSTTPSSVQLLGGNAMVGSVTAYQGATPWVITGSIQGGGGGVQYVEDTAQTSVTATAILFRKNDSTSIMGVISPNNPLPVGNTSVQVVGQMPVSSVTLVPGIGVLGSVAALQGTQPWLSQIVSSVATRPTPASVQLIGGNALIGSVAQAGNWLIQPASAQLLGGSNSIGSVTALQGTQPWLTQIVTSVATRDMGGGVSSVQLMAGTNNAGSITAIQGTNPWVIGNSSVQVVGAMPNSSVSGVGLFNVNHIGNGSVITVFSSPSIVGTYAEDATHSTNDKGIFALAVRNDTLSSITSADSDYSPIITGPSGEVITANSPITKWVSGSTSVMYGASVLVLSAPGASVYTYITGINVINESATASRVTITQGRGAVPASMLTWVIAPAGGGSNSTYINPIRVLDNNNVSASISGVSSVFVTITGFTSKS